MNINHNIGHKTVVARASAKASNQINMTEGPIFSKLLKFSIPLILSSVLQLLFNAADVVVVGRFAGDNSLAAVGSTGSLVNLLINLFIELLNICINTVQETDSKGNRTDIQIFLGNHFIGLYYFK